MAIPETPITRQEMYLDAIARKGGGGGGSALPAVTNADNGKVLSVVDGAWAADDTRFLVTCTPTAADFSGTMDKTWEEIDEAWNSGKSIWFSFPTPKGYRVLIPMATRLYDQSGAAYSFFIINNGQGVLINAYTHTGGGVHAYSTKIYQLTPMGS